MAVYLVFCAGIACRLFSDVSLHAFPGGCVGGFGFGHQHCGWGVSTGDVSSMVYE